MPLEEAPLVQPHDLGHAFYPGLLAINGGKMKRLQLHRAAGGPGGVHAVRPRVACRPTGHTHRFVVADHFFTSMYGRRSPEHLYNVAAQSYGIVDNKSTTNVEGNYCDDNTELRSAFPRRGSQRGRRQSDIMRLEETSPREGRRTGISSTSPPFGRAREPVSTSRCLPDQLEAKGIDWKYYALPTSG